MKHFIQIILSFFILHSSLFTFKAKAEDWKIYASYHNATKAVKTDARIFVLASGNLFSYDTEDESVEGYDKAHGLSDFGIYDIAYSKKAKTLVVLYSNGNIDLVMMDGHIWNMPELKTKVLADKTLNELKVVDDEAFISTGSGVAAISISKMHFADFYAFSSSVSNVCVQNGKIYAKTKSGIYEGERTSNLLDISNWTKKDSAPSGVTFGLTAEEKTEQSEMLAKVERIVIDSPARNYSYKLNMQGERLLVAGGNFYYPNVEYPGTAMKYENGKWTCFDEEGPIADAGAFAYMNVTDVVQDPSDSEHHWVGTMRSGIYEFKGYKMVNHYTFTNSPLTSILPNDKYANIYVRTTALGYDHEGNLWMCNNECDTIVRILKKNGSWKAYHYDEIEKYQTFDHTIFDQRGWAWITQRRTTSNGCMAGVLVVNTNGTIDNQGDDEHKFITSFSNQDGTLYTPNLYYCVKEDLNGAMWFGTSEGLFVSYEPRDLFNPTILLSQVKVPRNDGSNLADYLLNGVSIKCIAIDGGNRKWIGTNGNGVYLISADGLETIQHFTKDNSPLISDNINDIAINGQSGEVFIATDLGLCSYQGDATDASSTMSNSSLKVFPNPVRPEYSGNVHVTGLMMNSDVKIVNAAGKLVAQGTSQGGEYTWNCCTSTGKKAAAGIYYVLATDEEGNTGACTKILIVR